MFLNKKLLWNQSGFTLVEVIIACGLMGVTALIGASVIKMSIKNVQRTNANSSLVTEISEVKNGLKKIKQVSWSNFDPAESYAINSNSEVIKTEWTLSDPSEASFDVVGQDFRRNSHSLELSTTVLSESSFAFSRCVERADGNKLFTVQAADALANIPFLKYESGNPVIHCCQKGSINSSCNNPIINDESEYVLRTFFHKSPDTLKKFPLVVDNDYVDGIGFIFIFNQKLSPSSYEIALITQTRTCFLKEFKKSCKGALLTKLVKFGGSVKASGVNDNGIIQIR